MVGEIRLLEIAHIRTFIERSENEPLGVPGQTNTNEILSMNR